MATIKTLVTGSLKSRLIDLIRTRGPITVPEYMKLVLTNPESGFYMNEDVFGVKGHFTTNPEISQIFGEILGAWILHEWHRFECPKPLRLVEFGPGRGTLMADVTRTLRALGQEAPQIGLIEVSPHLRQVQKSTLERTNKKLLNSTKWFPNIESLKDDDQERPGFTAYIAHEFLDALPIHKFVRDPQSKKWRELLIDYDDKENLRFCIARQPSLSTRLLVPENFQGDHLEVCPEAALHLEKISNRLNETGSGFALICDYGFDDEPHTDCDNTETGPTRVTSIRPIKSNRDTFRAFKGHESWPPLRDPGSADLTADVDFGYLRRHLKGKATIFGPVNQRDFLLRCGLSARLDMLMSTTDNADERRELSSGAAMMVDDMGYRYKMMALFAKERAALFKDDPPAGFALPQ